MRLFLLNQFVKRRSRRNSIVRRSIFGRLQQIFWGAMVIFTILGAVFVVSGAIVFASITRDLPSLETLPVWLNPGDGHFLQPTRLYDRTGLKLLYSMENSGVPRRYMYLSPVNENHFSPYLPEMTVAFFQPDFWQKGGASWKDLLSPAPVTIAERLVTDLLLDMEPPGFRRSLRMRLLASQVVYQYGHDQVLEWTLNATSYGHLAYGADNAAYLYLNIPSSELDLAGSALLIAAAEAPSLNPLDSPKAAKERQEQVLLKLKILGAISEQEYLESIQREIIFRQPPVEIPEIARVFDHLVLTQLGEKFSQARIERGGLRIITTLDADLQKNLACTLQIQLLRMEKQLGDPMMAADQICDAALLLPTLSPNPKPYPPDLQASAVIMDPKSGNILALLGDTSINGESSLMPGHEPGSLLTPFVAVASFGKGFGPASLVWNIPQENFPQIGAKLSQLDKYEGPLRLRNAIANDYLIPVSQIIDQLGPENVWKQAEPFGLMGLASTPIPTRLLFEGGKINILQMAQAYGTFANGGTRVGIRFRSGENGPQPVTILFVEDLSHNRLVEETIPENQPVLSSQLAYLVNHILSDDVARRQSLGYPNPLETGISAGVKIGQLANGRQSWTAGYNQERVILTWIGLPEDVEADYQLDFRPSAGIWHALMQYTFRDLEVVAWEMPAGVSQVEVCDPSGLLPTSSCPMIVNEVFLSGNEPAAYDTLYQVFKVNRETGGLATVFTPAQLIEDRTYLVPPEEARNWASEVGLPVPPIIYDTVQTLPAQPGTAITSPALFAYIRGIVDILGSAGGELFGSYRMQVGQGLNPQTWQLVGEENPRPVEGNLLGTWDTNGMEDGLYAIRLQVLQTDQSIRTTITQVTVDNSPPSIQVASPKPDETLTLYNGQVNLQATVDDVFGVSAVEWVVDGKKIGELSQEPFVFSWEGTSGKHNLVARVIDFAGNSTSSPEIPFIIAQ